MPNTHRLGNFLDAWYFGSLGSKARIDYWIPLRSQSDDNSLGALLKLDPALGNGLDDKTKEALVARSDKFWASYSYPHIKMAMPHIRLSISRMICKYQTLRQHRLPECKYDCVIHYRVGDFITLGNTIPTLSVAKAVASITPKHAFIGIADGGRSFKTTDQSPSKKTILDLVQDLRNVGMTGTIQCFSGDVDSDFFRCAQAPILVTGPGSFAVWAAIANGQGRILTPATENMNFPSRGSRQPEQIAPNWRTYSW